MNADTTHRTKERKKEKNTCVCDFSSGFRNNVKIMPIFMKMDSSIGVIVCALMFVPECIQNLRNGCKCEHLSIDDLMKTNAYFLNVLYFFLVSSNTINVFFIFILERVIAFLLTISRTCTIDQYHLDLFSLLSRPIVPKQREQTKQNESIKNM